MKKFESVITRFREKEQASRSVEDELIPLHSRVIRSMAGRVNEKSFESGDCESETIVSNGVGQHRCSGEQQAEQAPLGLRRGSDDMLPRISAPLYLSREDDVCLFHLERGQARSSRRPARRIRREMGESETNKIKIGIARKQPGS